MQGTPYQCSTVETLYLHKGEAGFVSDCISDKSKYEGGGSKMPILILAGPLYSDDHLDLDASPSFSVNLGVSPSVQVSFSACWG